MNPLQANSFALPIAPRGPGPVVVPAGQPVSGPLETFIPTAVTPGVAETSETAVETPAVSLVQDAPPPAVQAQTYVGMMVAGSLANPTTLTMFEEPPVEPSEPEPQWVEKTNKQGQTFKERPVSSLDGGPAWREIVFTGGKPFRERQVAAEDGGPAWKEIQFPESQSPGYKKRSLPAEDGGPAWQETLSANGNISRTRTVPAQDGGADWVESVRNGETSRQRNVPSQDDKPDWSEVICGDKHTRSRNFEADGVVWNETITGDQGKRRVKDGIASLQAVAKQSGTTRLGEAEVHGKLTAQQLENLRAALEAMPPEARALARDISVLDSLGIDLTGEGKENGGGPGGLAASGLMAVKAAQLDKPFNARRVVFHETGHLLDKAHGVLSDKPPWGDGSSVSAYGRTSPGEDFAEVHRVVLSDFESFRQMSPSDWARQSECAKKLQIAALYGLAVPTMEEIKAAETPEILEQRALNEAADVRTSGRELGNVTAAEDGGNPWVEKLSVEGQTYRERTVPAQDGAGDWLEVKFPDNTYKKRTLPAGDEGPAWTEFQYPDSKPYRQRMVPSGDGGPDWKELQFADSKPYKSRMVGDWKEVLTQGAATPTRSRRVRQHGLEYEEKWQGEKWSRHPVGEVAALREAARSQGTSSFTVGPLQIQVHGGATAAELQTLQAAVVNLPPAARVLVANISLGEDLGQFSKNQEAPTELTALHDGQGLAMQRSRLKDPAKALGTLAFGAGLGADRLKKLSQEPLWKDSQPSFLTVHSRVLRDFRRFAAFSEGEWAARPDAAKERAIVDQYRVAG